MNKEMERRGTEMRLCFEVETAAFSTSSRVFVPHRRGLAAGKGWEVAARNRRGVAYGIAKHCH